MVAANDKPFSEKEYAECDGPAKDCGWEWMASIGMTDIEENLDEAKKKFGRIWDVRGFIQTTCEGRKEIRVEFEVKKDWGTKWKEDEWKGKPCPFPYPTMDFPYRKRDKAKEHATHMVIVGGDYARLFVVHRPVMLQSPVENKWCRNRRQEEPFYRVALPAPQSCFYEKTPAGLWVKSTQVFHAG